MRTDYTIILTVEHPEDGRPGTQPVEAEVTELLRLSSGAEPGEVAFIGVEVTGWRPWPDNPSDPRSWVSE